MSAPPGVWCAIPVYNNAATIAEVARKSREQLPNVLVIDDGGTDADLRELLRPLDVTVIRHQNNLGKGAALLTAMRYALERGAQYLITLDGDGQHFPEDIPRFFPHLSPDAIAVGDRREVTGLMPRSSRFGRDFSDFWIELETGRAVRDSQSGFRAYPLPASLQLKPNSDRYGFEVEILTRAFWAGMRAQTVPIRVWYPPAAHRVSSFHPLRDNFRISRLHARLVLRQLLPLPHQPLQLQGRSTPPPTKAFLTENSNPLGLSTAGALSILLGILLWPWGIIPVAYIAFRLHLNKPIALAGILLCMPSALATWSARIGHAILRADSRPRLERFIGSHLIAIPAALIAGSLVYAAARRLRPGPQR